MGVEGDGQVVGPTFGKIALAVLGSGLAARAVATAPCSDWRIPSSWTTRARPATPAGHVEGGVDLDQERGESNRPKVLGGDDSDVSQVTEEMGCTSPCLARLSFQYMARRSCTTIPV